MCDHKADLESSTIRRGRKKRKKCSHEGCKNQSYLGGVCRTHGAKVKKCSHEGCKSNLANNVTINAAAIVEEESPHEIYASLIEKPSARQCTAAACGSTGETAYATAVRNPWKSSLRDNTTARRPRLNPSSGNNDRSNNDQGGAYLIPTDDCYSEPSSSSSQFISFYRKSCISQQLSGGVDRGRGNNSRSNNTDNASKAQSESKKVASVKSNRYQTAKAYTPSSTTKSERRRMAKLERERGVRKEKRIRMMLRADISEEDELLYRCLNR